MKIGFVSSDLPAIYPSVVAFFPFESADASLAPDSANLWVSGLLQRRFAVDRAGGEGPECMTFAVTTEQRVVATIIIARREQARLHLTGAKTFASQGTSIFTKMREKNVSAAEQVRYKPVHGQRNALGAALAGIGRFILPRPEGSGPHRPQPNVHAGDQSEELANE